MPAWLSALLNVLPSIIEAIIGGLKGSPPSALAPEAEHAEHAGQIAKYEALLALVNK